MRIDIPQAQKNFFLRHHYLELENFFNEKELSQARTQFQALIPNKNASYYDVFMGCHDVWRTNPIMSFIRTLGKVAATLTDKSQLTLAFDQCLRTSSNPIPDSRFPIACLSANSSVSSLVCGAIVNLSAQSFLEPATELPIGEDVSTLIPLPHTPGSVIFCGPNIPLDYPKFLEIPNQLCYLVAFSNVKPLYIHCESDLHTNALKNFGYTFGDHLNETTHPIVAR